VFEESELYDFSYALLCYGHQKLGEHISLLFLALFYFSKFLSSFSIIASPNLNYFLSFVTLNIGVWTAGKFNNNSIDFSPYSIGLIKSFSAELIIIKIS
jgi:hypothetical protein